VTGARTMSDNTSKTLCNIGDLCSMCTGHSNGLTFDEMREQCDACVKSTYFNRCMYLCIDGRCDSQRARDVAAQTKGR